MPFNVSGYGMDLTGSTSIAREGQINYVAAQSPMGVKPKNKSVCTLAPHLDSKLPFNRFDFFTQIACINFVIH